MGDTFSVSSSPLLHNITTTTSDQQNSSVNINKNTIDSNKDDGDDENSDFMMTTSKTTIPLRHHQTNSHFQDHHLFVLPYIPKPSETLMQYIRERNWILVKERILGCPWDAQWKNPTSYSTPLHIACLYRAPHDVIQLLVEAYPIALFTQDTEGWTPLHVNLLYGSPQIETTLFLIEWGGTRLARIQSSLVGTPLHLWCRHASTNPIWTPEVLCALIVACPDVIMWGHGNDTNRKRTTSTSSSSSSSSSGTVANVLWKSLLRDVYLPLDYDHHRALQLLISINWMIAATKGHLHRIGVIPTNIMNDMTTTMTQIKKDDILLYPLHDYIVFQHEYANQTDLVALIVRLYPESIHELDTFGRLPLHVAACHGPLPSTNMMMMTTSNPYYSRSRNQQQQTERPGSSVSSSTLINTDPLFHGRHCPRDTLLLLLATDDSLANVPLPNEFIVDPASKHICTTNADETMMSYENESYCIERKDSRSESLFPLHLAIRWGGRTWPFGVQQIATAAPETLLVACPTTRLLPFQLAACQLDGNSGMDVETIFQLLLTCPHATDSARKKEFHDKQNGKWLLNPVDSSK